MTSLVVDHGDFRIGRVLGRSFAILAADFAKLYLVAGIAATPVLALRLYDFFYLAARLRLYFDVPLVGFEGVILATASLYFAVSQALTAFGQAAIAVGAVEKARGGRFDLRQSLRRALARILPILGLLLTIGATLAAAASPLLFAMVYPLTTLEDDTMSYEAWRWLTIVAGALALAAAISYILTRWFVALPACVVERCGPLRSLRRSAFLTRRCRWKIFGLYVLVSLAANLVAGVMETMLPSLLGRSAAAVGVYLWVSLIAAFEAVMLVVAYLELRAAKEGIDAERVAAVFD